MNLREKIYNLRKERGLSQEEMAEKLGVSRQAVSRWEMNTAIPDAVNLLALSKLFSVSADYLLNDDYLSDKDIPAVKTARAHERSEANIRATFKVFIMPMLTFFVCALISWKGIYSDFLTMLFLLPAAGLGAAFELSRKKYNASDLPLTNSYRRKFYSLMLILFLYFPLAILSRHTSGMSEFSAFILYIIIGVFGLGFIKKLFRPKE